MQDKWMNIGHDDEPLKPYREVLFNDHDDERLREFLIVFLTFLYFKVFTTVDQSFF